MPDGLETPNPAPEEKADKKDIFDQVIQAVEDRKSSNIDELMGQFTAELNQLRQKYVNNQKKEAPVIDGQSTFIEGAELQIDVESLANIIHGYIDPRTKVNLIGKENSKEKKYSDIFNYATETNAIIVSSFESDFRTELEDTLKVLQLFKYSEKTTTTVEEMRTKLPVKEGKNESDSVYPLYKTMQPDDLRWTRIIQHVIVGRISPILAVLDEIK